MTIQKGDFVELDFVGRIKETNQIFDLTDEKLAKKENIHDPKQTYGPKIICVGEQQLVKGIDKFLIGKELKTYTIDVTPEQGFGKKDARLLKLVPLSTFKKEKIQPFPGLQLNIDNHLGIVRTVSGGRIIVDFNHPLAGRNLIYELTIKRQVKDTQEQLQHYLNNLFNKEVKCKVEKDKATITMTVPEHLQKPLKEQVQKVIPALKEITLEEEKATKPKTTTQA
tara:strand:- start:67232 stop:67903 length:672 start_codon:yes stop_codon:yes gene_type:complete